jgi:hypothetical protein
MKITIQITILFLCSVFNGYSQSTHDFRLKLDAGQCYSFVKETKTEGIATIHGETSNIYFYTLFEDEYKVARKVKNGFELSITKKDFAADIQNAMIKSKQSSELADEYNIYNPSTITFLQLNRPYTAFISDKGKVLKIKNINNLLTDVKKKIDNIKDKESKQLYTSMLPTEQSLADEIEKLTAFFPKTPISIGDKWDIYEFAEETDSTCIINGYRTLYEDGQAQKDTIMMGMILETMGSGTEKMVIVVDKKSCLPSSFQIINSSDTEQITRTKEGNEIIRASKVATSTITITTKLLKNE